MILSLRCYFSFVFVEVLASEIGFDIYLPFFRDIDFPMPELYGISRKDRGITAHGCCHGIDTKFFN